MKGGGLLGLAALAVVATAIENPEEYANTLVGTDNTYEFSHGNSLPITAVPRGFNHWAPTTYRYLSEDPGNGWWFNLKYPKFQGIKLTHQPSPWINDWAYLVFATHMGAGAFYESYWESWNAITRPYHFKTTLGSFDVDGGNTTMEVTPSNYGAILRFSYPPYDNNANFRQRRRIDIMTFDEHKNGTYPDDPTVGDYVQFTGLDTLATDGVFSGVTNKMGWGGPNEQLVENGWGFYFYAELSPKPDSFNVQIQSWPNWMPVEEAALKRREFLQCVYDAENNVQEVTLKIATSHISPEQAKLNFEHDKLNTMSFDELMAETKQKWRNALNRIEVIDTGYDRAGEAPEEEENVLKTFYSNLYRTQLFPRDLTEYDSQGNAVHYPFFMLDNPDNKTSLPGVLYTDIGSWDAYHTMYPLLQLAYPSVIPRIMQSWIHAYDEGGWIPQWSSPSYKASMVGTMSDVAAADAILGDLHDKFDKFDRMKLFEASINNAYNTDRPIGEVGRDGIDEYQKYGFVPVENEHGNHTFHESVSRSLDYYQADWALWKAAEYLGRNEDAARLEEYSSKNLELFDTESKFFRAKFINGSWADGGLDPYLWKGGYTEGNAWIYRFFAPQDPQGLADIYGGPVQLCEWIKNMTEVPVIVHTGANMEFFHELAEMYRARIGQYGHSNQPSHYILYLMSAIAGANPDNAQVQKTCGHEMQKIIRRVMRDYYQPKYYLGDEDNGEMSAWYILSAMGLYDLAPGSGYFQIGTPLFRHIRLHLETDAVWPPADGVVKTDGFIDFIAEGNSGDMEQATVSSFEWKDEPLKDWRLSYKQLMEGGTLRFTLEKKYVHPRTSDAATVKASMAMLIGLALVLFTLA